MEAFQREEEREERRAECEARVRMDVTLEGVERRRVRRVKRELIKALVRG